MKHLVLVVSLLFVSTMAMALDEGQLKIGGLIGHVGLHDEVGSSAGNAIGYGGFLGYMFTQEMFFEASYLKSSHTRLNHESISAGVDFYFNSYDASYFYFSGGADLIQHSISISGNDYNSSGFGLYGGIGVDFEVTKRMIFGLNGQYHHAFDASVTPTGSTSSVKSIQRYVTVMLRLAFSLNDGK